MFTISTISDLAPDAEITLVLPSRTSAKCLMRITGTVPEGKLSEVIRDLVVDHMLDVHMLTVTLNGELVEFQPHPQQFIADGAALSGEKA